MLQDTFTKLDTLETQNLVAEINPRLGPAAFGQGGVTILSAHPSFYPGYKLLDMADHAVMPSKRTIVLYREENGDITPLNWTSSPIYKVNREAPVKIDETTVRDYARFFLGAVRGRHGRFHLIETIDDIAWKEEPPPATRKAIGLLLEPVRVSSVGENGAYVMDVRTLFKDALFRCAIRVAKDGTVEIGDQELILEDIPVLDDALAR